MNPAAELAVFAGVMALGQFSPGPDMFLLTRTALAEGTKAGVLTALGIATGLCLHAAVAIGGAAVLFERFPLVRKCLSWAAAAYLLWLAWQLGRACFRAWRAPSEGAEPALPMRRNAYLRGLMCNLLNPKVVVFLVAVVAPFLKHNDAPAWWPFALWAVIALEGGVLWALWARLLQWQPLKDGYRRAQPLIDAAFAVVLLGLAVKLVC